MGWPLMENRVFVKNSDMRYAFDQLVLYIGKMFGTTITNFIFYCRTSLALPGDIAVMHNLFMFVTLVFTARIAQADTLEPLRLAIPETIA